MHFINNYKIYFILFADKYKHRENNQGIGLKQSLA